MVVKKAFRKNIEKNEFPKKSQIMDFINKNNKMFSESDFSRIRTLVVNEYTFK